MITWQQQLIKATKNNDDIFGTNIEWDVKDVKHYLNKLNQLGCRSIEIPDKDTIIVSLPCDLLEKRRPNCKTAECLLYIMTYQVQPCQTSFNKKSFKLTMEFDY